MWGNTIIVGEGDYLPLGLCKAGIARGSGAFSLYLEVMEVMVFFLEHSDKGGGAISRIIVNNHDFIALLGIILRTHAGKALLKGFHPIVGGNNDGNKGGAHGKRIGRGDFIVYCGKEGMKPMER